MMQPEREPSRHTEYSYTEPSAEELRQEALRREAELERRRREVAQRQLAEELVNRERRIEQRKADFTSRLKEALTGMGYLPPAPAPLITTRAFKLTAQSLSAGSSDPETDEAVTAMRRELDALCEASVEYFDRLSQGLTPSNAFFRSFQLRLAGMHPSIAHAKVTLEPPEVAAPLREKILEIERFLARDWVADEQRGVLAVHFDEPSQTTIIQIGIAPHGPVYITIPGKLQPEELALRSIRALMDRLEPFSGVVDPMAVINGTHQGLNYNEVFVKTRVMRAPSGDTARLVRNIREAKARPRLSPGNTTVLNSAPRSLEQYQRVFPHDPDGRHWSAWGGEADSWNSTVTSAQFTAAPDLSRERLVTALAQSKNVIVIVAHCDGQSLFMPEPPPTGTVVTAEYLLEHREEISANAPFVYLFSCEAGRLANLQNFASTLLECGASGVIASQSELGAAEGRTLLGRLLDQRRGEPPLDDYYQAMDETRFREMEVFLA